MTNAHRRTPRTCFGQISQPNGPATNDALSAMLAHAPVNDLDQWQEGERLPGIDVPAIGVSPVARNVCEIATARSWELARRQPDQHGILLPCQAEQAHAARRSRVAPHRRKALQDAASGNAQRLEETTARSFARQKPPSAAERESRFRGKAESTPEKERQAMTNPFHQTIAASSSTLPVSSPKDADRMRQWAVRLYNANNDALFHWSAKAKTALEAVATARSRYSDALEAIYRAQGLTRSDASSDLIVAESEVLKASMPNAWRLTNRASWEAAKHPKAQRALLGMPLAHDIVTSIAMTDPGCIAALQHDHALVLGMWLSAVGKDQLIDIDSCWLVSTPDGTIRVPHSNGVLRNVLRLFALRALSPRHAIGNPRSHPFNGYRLVINGQSKTLLAAQMIRKPTAPFVVLNWLESEGFMDVASQYRSGFEPSGEETRSRG